MSMKALRRRQNVEGYYQCYVNPVLAEVVADSEG